MAGLSIDSAMAVPAATRDGVTAELCTATQGVADLKIGKATFECQMRQRAR